MRKPDGTTANDIDDYADAWIGAGLEVCAFLGGGFITSCDPGLTIRDHPAAPWLQVDGTLLQMLLAAIRDSKPATAKAGECSDPAVAAAE